LGENEKKLSTQITKKYIFAALLNCRIRLFGAHVSSEYLEVLTLLEQNFPIASSLPKET
jgi:hypothetical protein